MLDGKRIAVVLPAYNAAKTLRRTVEELPRDVVDDIILVDDLSIDDTVRIGHELNLFVAQHESNRGYGANQKTCYTIALETKCGYNSHGASRLSIFTEARRGYGRDDQFR